MRPPRIWSLARENWSRLEATDQIMRANGRPIFRNYSSHQDNHYRALGLQPGASQTDIKKAFFQLSKEYHPDKNAQNTTAHKQYSRITEAYTVLKDPSKRRLYDEHLARYASDKDNKAARFYRERANAYRCSGRPQSSFTGNPGASTANRAYDPQTRWDYDRYGHRPEFHGAQPHEQRKNRFSNMGIVAFTFLFMAVGVVVQMARFNSHYESTASNLQAMNDDIAAVYAKTREEAQARGYKEKLRQLKGKSSANEDS